MKLVDTNILLRYLLNDHPEMSAKAMTIMLDSEVLLLTQVVAEAVYVLGGVYKIGAQKLRMHYARFFRWRLYNWKTAKL